MHDSSSLPRIPDLFVIESLVLPRIAKSSMGQSKALLYGGQRTTALPETNSEERSELNLSVPPSGGTENALVLLNFPKRTLFHRACWFSSMKQGSTTISVSFGSTRRGERVRIHPHARVGFESIKQNMGDSDSIL